MRRSLHRQSTGVASLLLGTVLTACAPGGSQSGSAAAEHRTSSPPGPSVGLPVGQRAPTFMLTTIDGAPVASADLLAQDKPYILYFFATW